jgi:arsenical pump membrane protein
MTAEAATWGISALATGGVILRPFRLPEAIWAVAGAAALVALGLLKLADAWAGIAKGADVYLFLTGMMLLAELARREGLFAWLAAHAANAARGSAARLFTLLYGVGIAVTVLLSNDATSVVLTPAVAAVARAAKAQNPLPYLLICAFVANAASFVLPISNPANLVIYGGHMPPLAVWLPRFALPSICAIAATYAVLRLTQRAALREGLAAAVDRPVLTAAARAAGLGIIGTALALMVASAMGWQLGLPSFAAGALTTAAVLLIGRTSPLPVLARISWGVLPLVAGLFVMVEALNRTGLIALIAKALGDAVRASAPLAAIGAGTCLALVCNLVNNLPAGLVAGTAVQSAHAPDAVTGAVLIGVDLGPNLSVTGSLATILWLACLRRENLRVGAATFLKLGALVMPPALLLSLAALLAFSH